MFAAQDSSNNYLNIASAINIIKDNKNISKGSKKIKKDQMCVVCVCSTFRGTNQRTTRTNMGNMM